MARKLESVITISIDRCKGCGLCAQSCPGNLLGIDSQRLNTRGYHPAYLLNGATCTGCADCAQMCPDCAITITTRDSGGRNAEDLGKR